MAPTLAALPLPLIVSGTATVKFRGWTSAAGAATRREPRLSTVVPVDAKLVLFVMAKLEGAQTVVLPVKLLLPPSVKVRPVVTRVPGPDSGAAMVLAPPLVVTAPGSKPSTPAPAV